MLIYALSDNGEPPIWRALDVRTAVWDFDGQQVAQSMAIPDALIDKTTPWPLRATKMYLSHG